MEAADLQFRKLLSGISAVLVTGVALVSAWAVATKTDGYARMFADFRLKLPTLTIFVIANDTLIGGFLVLIAVGAAAKEFLLEDRLLTLAINGLLLLVVLAVMFLCILAMRMPYDTLLEGLRG